MNAVDSEHEKNLMNDAWRLFQLEKATGSPSHPFSKFGTGVVYTLMQDVPRRRETILTWIDVAKCYILFCNDNGSFHWSINTLQEDQLIRIYMVFFFPIYNVILKMYFMAILLK